MLVLITIQILIIKVLLLLYFSQKKHKICKTFINKTAAFYSYSDTLHYSVDMCDMIFDLYLIF